MQPTTGKPPSVLRVGLLYSSTGPLAKTEMSIQQGAVLAVDEINSQHADYGVRIELAMTDYGSDPANAGRRVRDLSRNQDVQFFVGGYTSASRVSIVAALADTDSLYIYPTYYEGLERDPHTVYVGAVPNQFFNSYMQWILETLGTRIYVVGSDYVYPRTLGVLIQTLAREAGADVVADRYVPMGSIDVTEILKEIGELRPDVVISNLVGMDSVGAFYRGFFEAGWRADTLPIAATVTTELEVRETGAEYVAGHYMASTYFNSLANANNQAYLTSLKARFGEDTVAHVTQVGAYNALWLLAQAHRLAFDRSPTGVMEALSAVQFDGNPEGWPIAVTRNNHTTHGSYIGQCDADGQYRVVQEFRPRMPDPYPASIVASDRRPPGA